MDAGHLIRKYISWSALHIGITMWLNSGQQNISENVFCLFWVVLLEMQVRFPDLFAGPKSEP
jgi:hypothetical protein